MMGNNREVKIFDTYDEMADFAVEKWKEIALKSVSDRGCFTVALSGGKTPIRFYEKLSCSGERMPWDKTHVFMADERYVPFVNKDNNYRSLKETLLDRVVIPKENIHPIPVEEKSPRLTAVKYEEVLKAFFEVKEGDLPVFDLIMLGIGEDGHTASLFPGSSSLGEKEHLVIADKAEVVMHERISIILPVINNAKNVIFLISGQNKAAISREVIEDGNTGLPAVCVAPSKGRLLFLMDQEAGRYLDHRP